ncbi:MAG: hypothetical protein ABF990_10475 [Acetobacter sp.]|uniref:hypothetical protein n=1 Tax=Acetobacter sp. TaxID=440 RepID=UPI0039E7BB5D
MPRAHFSAQPCFPGFDTGCDTAPDPARAQRRTSRRPATRARKIPPATLQTAPGLTGATQQHPAPASQKKRAPSARTAADLSAALPAGTSSDTPYGTPTGKHAGISPATAAHRFTGKLGGKLGGRLAGGHNDGPDGPSGSRLKGRPGPPTGTPPLPPSARQDPPDLFSLPLPALPRSHFTPDELRLAPVPASTLMMGRTSRPAQAKGQAATGDGNDACLYLVTTDEEAAHFLAHGLKLSRATPIMLTERDGIGPWLAKLAENVTDEAPCSNVVLRLRRAMVAQALEPEPDHSAEFAARCYLLSGN